MTPAATRRRRYGLGTAVTAAALVAFLGPAGTASAAPAVLTVGQGVLNTAARATVANDGGARVDTAFQVRQFRTDRVLARNLAAATTRQCSDCQSAAISFQIVVAQTQALDLRATNLAQATNIRCQRCESLAVALQFVVAGPDVLLDDRALQELDAIGRELEALDRSAVPTQELLVRVDALADRVLRVLTGAGEDSGPAAAATTFSEGGSSSGARPTVTVNRDVDVTGS